MKNFESKHKIPFSVYYLIIQNKTKIYKILQLVIYYHPSYKYNVI